MNIAMLTNTYRPHVGGVAHSVDRFAGALRAAGHRVRIVAPTFAGADETDPDVVRVPAIQQFNGSDFSVQIPVPGLVTAALDEFQPEVIHAHHPFLLGVTALRTAAVRGLPLVFTHHTLYDQYTHYVVDGDAPGLRVFIGQLAADYCNLCDHVIAPSASVARLLHERGVRAPLSVIPTGVDARQFTAGDGAAARRAAGIPVDAFVVGHVGRLAPEKNLEFLARAVAALLATRPQAHFLVVGSGPAEATLRDVFAERGLAARLHLAGTLEGRALADAYHACELFAFASKSETQGMVLAEALTAGVPVVALDASGARDVVADGRNGRLLGPEDEAEFAAALRELVDQPAERGRLAAGARETAVEFSIERCTERLLGVYAGLVGQSRSAADESAWTETIRLLQTEWNLWAGRASAAAAAIAAALASPAAAEREAAP